MAEGGALFLGVHITPVLIGGLCVPSSALGSEGQAQSQRLRPQKFLHSRSRSVPERSERRVPTGVREALDLEGRATLKPGERGDTRAGWLHFLLFLA